MKFLLPIYTAASQLRFLCNRKNHAISNVHLAMKVQISIMYLFKIYFDFYIFYFFPELTETLKTKSKYLTHSS